MYNPSPHVSVRDIKVAKGIQFSHSSAGRADVGLRTWGR